MTDHGFLDARGRTRVVVTGIGVKTPAGTDVDTMWDTVLAGRGTAGRIERWDPSELPVQFAEFATWQHQWMQGAVSDHQLAYWKKRFATIPPVIDMPHKGPRPAAQTFRGTSLRPEIPLALCNDLRALSRREGSTLFMTMLAGFMALEVGTDHALGLGGIVTEPYLLLRVREGSPCSDLLIATAFQRGRKPEERVAVLRPKLPTVAETLALIEELVQLLTQAQPPARSAPSSTGKVASARKPLRPASPAHAM